MSLPYVTQCEKPGLLYFTYCNLPIAPSVCTIAVL